MRIDSAVNLAAEAFTPDVLWRILHRNKFEGAIVSAASPDPVELAWLLEQKRQHPWILGIVACGEEAIRDHCLGVWLPAERLRPERLTEIAARGLTVDLHLRSEQLPEALRVAERWPSLPLAVLHMGQPRFDTDFDAWARAMESLATVPSISIKISGLIHDADPAGWDAALYRPYIQHLLRTFPIHRLMFGSDWPRCARAWTWKQSLAAFTQALGAQTMENRELLLGENARRHYRLAATE